MHLVLWLCVGLSVSNAVTKTSSGGGHSSEKIVIEPSRVEDDAITSVTKSATSIYKKGQTSAKVDLAIAMVRAGTMFNGPSKVTRQSQTSRVSRRSVDLDLAIDDFIHPPPRPHRHSPEGRLARPHRQPFLKPEDYREYEDSPEDSYHFYPHHIPVMPSFHQGGMQPQVYMTPQLHQPWYDYPFHQRFPPPPHSGHFPSHQSGDFSLYDEPYDRIGGNPHRHHKA